MNDQDAIWAGVELADGFDLKDRQYFFCDRFGVALLTTLQSHPIELFLDALAAQLVRQYYKKRPMQYPLTHEADPLITIKDILASRVLLGS